MINPQSQQQVRLLFVDDEVNVLNALKRVLRNEGYHITAVTSAQLALEHMEAQEVDMVISDFRMPGINGVELLKEVRQRHPQTIRMLLTGESDTTEAMNGLQQESIYKFILKPWDNEDVKFIIKRAIHRHKSGEIHSTDPSQVGRNMELGFDILHNSQLAEVLEKAGFTNKKETLQLCQVQAQRNVSVIQQLMENNWISEAELSDAIAQHLAFKVIKPDLMTIPATLAGIFPEELCIQQVVLPVALTSDTIVVACADPTNSHLYDELCYLTGRSITLVVAPMYTLYNKIVSTFQPESAPEQSEAETELFTQVEAIGELIESVYEDISQGRSVDISDKLALVNKVKQYREQLAKLGKDMDSS